MTSKRPWCSNIGRLPALLLLTTFWSIASVAAPAVEMEVFVREGCPRCSAAEAFLAGLTGKRPELLVQYRDVGRDPPMLARLRQLAAERHISQVGLPAFFIRDRLIVGYQDEVSTGARLLELLDHVTNEAMPNKVEACRVEPREGCAAPADADQGISLPWIGRTTVRDVGLPLFTIAIGLLDGFNPCAMWVLLFLLSLLVSLRNRYTMALVAGTFVVVSGLVYFAFMAAWLNLFLVIGLSRGIQLVLGTMALVIGAINVKDFYAFRRGLTLTIPERAKPGLFARLRDIVQAEHLVGALIGVTVLAILVNVVELLCTAGFPALYTQILTMQQLPAWHYYGYLALYNLAYIFDDAAMVTITVITLSHRKLAEREGRWLKLAGGAVMIGLGLILLVKPNLLV
ncbi:MAG: NrdH-redoxin [Nitrospiraceae bacterium]|nr:NrdH-redoxin [Nitrospiraceae bacterium]